MQENGPCHCFIIVMMFWVNIAAALICLLHFTAFTLTAL